MIYTPYLWPKLLAALVPAGFAWYMRRFRETPAARPFSVLMGLTALWALLHVLNSVTVSLPLRIFWGHVQVVTFVFLAPTTLALALEYSGQAHRLSRRRWLLLLCIPVLTILIEWTSAYHPFYRYDLAMDLSGPTPILLSSKGFWYWVNVGYAYLLTLTACGRLLTAFPVQTPYFWNATVIALGILLPFLVDLLYILGVTPIPGYNLSSTMFIFTGALQLWAILRWQTFDLIPVAREMMLEQMPEGMIVVDAQQRIVDVNPAAVAILGVPRARLVGQMLAADARFPTLKELAHALVAVPAQPLLELEIAQRWYQVSSAPLADPRGLPPGRLVILRDITELKRAQARFIEQQRALAMTEERARLARELHDGLGQTLGYVKMRAQVARDLLAQGEIAELDGYLANLVTVAQEAHTDIREYLLGVRSSDAPDVTFLDALQHYLTQFRRNYGICAELTASDIQENLLEPTTEVQLLRIIQEALTNTRKYAQATRVQINLTLQETQVHVVIQDDGQGFDPTQPAVNGPTFGLRFMRERAEELHGSLEVQSAPGQGARIVVKIPLRT